METLLSDRGFHTILVDPSLRSDGIGIASGVDCCEGLLKARAACFIEDLKDDWDMIHADFPNSAGTLLIAKVQAVKHSGCQAILDAKPVIGH